MAHVAVAVALKLENAPQTVLDGAQIRDREPASVPAQPPFIDGSHLVANRNRARPG